MNYAHNGYTYRKSLTLAAGKVTSGTIYTDFVSLVSLTDTALKSVANGGKVQLNTALDIRFETTGGVKLPHEVEYHDPVTGTLRAWVKHTIPSTATTEIRMYYGKAIVTSEEDVNNAWPAGYQAVYHMDDTPDAVAGNEQTDSSGNARHMASSGSMGAGNKVTGKIGEALDFDGADDYVSIASSLGLTNVNVTLSCWIFLDTASEPAVKKGAFIKVGAGNGYGIGVGGTNFDNTGNKLIVLYESLRWIVTGSMTIGWHRVSLVINASGHPRVFLDGTAIYADSSGAPGSPAGDNIAYIGGYPGRLFDGKIDEVHMLNVALSDNWIAAEYQNQNDPATFFTVGAEQVADRYWIGGTGTYNDTAHWSYTSGGAGGAPIPTTDNHAIFDANSFSADGQILTIPNIATARLNARTIDFSAIDQDIVIHWNNGATNSWTVGSGGNVALDVAGDLILSDRITTTWNAANAGICYISIIGLLQTNNLDMAGVDMTGYNGSARVNMWFTGDASLSSEAKTGAWEYGAGKNLTTNNHNITVSGSLAWGYADHIVDAGTSVITLKGKDGVLWTLMKSYSETVDLSAATVVLEGIRTELYNERTSGISFNVGTVKFGADGTKGVITGVQMPARTVAGFYHGFLYDTNLIKLYRSQTLANVYIAPGGTTFTLQSGQTYTVTGTFEVRGVSGTKNTLTVHEGTTAAIISKASGEAHAHHTNIQYSTGSGGATFKAYDSTNLGSNTNWTFLASPPPVSAATVSNVSLFGTPNLQKVIDPSSVINGNTFGLPDVYYGAQYITPQSIESAAAFGLPYVSTRLVEPQSIESGNTFGDIFISNYTRQLWLDESILSTADVSDSLNVFNKTNYLTLDQGVDNHIEIPKPNILGELAINDTAPSYEIYNQTVKALRDIAGAVTISFERTYDASVDFYEVGVSAFDLSAVWRGDGSTVQEWDKFNYTDYTDRLDGYEYHYEQDILGGMVLGMADFTLRNDDGYFSPYGTSPIAAHILPNRPLRLFAGFKRNLVQVFVGQTTRLPEASKDGANFHAKDFIASFADTTLDNGRTWVNMTTAAIIDDVLQNVVGLSPTQYTLDAGLNTIGFLHAPADTKIGELFRDLMQAERGRIYQRQDGEIIFNNRNNLTTPTAITLRSEHVFSEADPDVSNVINRVKISADVREVQASQQIFPALKDGSLTDYEDFGSFEVAAGATVDKFFNSKDPVTAYTYPVANTGYLANTASDGTGTNVTDDVPYTVTAEFTDSIKVSFTNNTAAAAHVTKFELFGTPAKVIEEIRVDVIDQPSIDKYGEELLEYTNDAFDNSTFAASIAQEIVTQNKDAPNIREMTVKGIPYLEVGNVVSHYEGDDYIVDYIVGKLSPTNGYTQTVRLRLVV